jgi:RNA polymerase-associated protein RTF1
MTEFNRERILEERSEQKQHLQNARALADMVKQQQRGGSGGGVPPGDDSVSRAAKRMLYTLSSICILMCEWAF